jgi:GntR family transcriptional regulator/MocR family aminotransferase
MRKTGPGALLACIDLEVNQGFPIYHRLYLELRKAILNGALTPGMKLPSTRALAEDLGLSRTPVKAAYERLKGEGYASTIVGSGTVVSQVVRRIAATRLGTESDAVDRAERQSPISERGALGASAIWYSKRDEARPFTPHLLAFDSLPMRAWSRLVARQWRRFDNDILGYCPLGGLGALREALSKHLKIFRGVECEPQQVVITPGVQSAHFVLAQMLAQPGDGICVEDPGDIGARSAFVAAGLSILPVPVDSDGFSPPAQVSNHSARLAHITPSRQWPLGVTMGLERRLQVLEWAKANDIWIIEDDYDSELSYKGEHVPALQGLDRAGRVLYVGTFTKILFPSLRIGYAVLPHGLVGPFIKLVEAMTRGGSGALQAALAQFIDEGHFNSHIRQMRKIHAQRRQVLIEAANEEIGDLMSLRHSDTGAHLIGWLPDDIDPEVVSRQAERRNITAIPISRYCISPYPRGGLMLGFGHTRPEDIRPAVRELALAIRDARRS